MAAVLQPDKAWNCNFAGNYDSLEQLHQVLADAQGWQHFADILADLRNSQDAWNELLCAGRAEDAGSIAQKAILASHGTIFQPEAEKTLADFFRTVVNISHDNPLMAALVLGGTLSALRSDKSETSHTRSHVISIHMLQIWFAGSALEAVVNALIRGDFKDEVAQACSGWLCSLPDRVTQAFGGSSSATVMEFSDWLQKTYSRRLVAAMLSSVCGMQMNKEGDFAPTTIDLLARLTLRGNATVLAAHLCAKALMCNCSVVVVGHIIAKLSEEHASAGRTLVCAILEATGAVLQNTSSELVAYCGAENLLKILQPALGRGLPIQQLLAVHIWQVPLGSQLSAAVVFALVDELMAGECSSDVSAHWFRTWADPSHRDVPAEQNLALRVARTLRWQSPAEHLHLLLQGVHNRLSAQAKETRLYGMAVAETMASSWISETSDKSEEREEKLQFENFDRDDASVIAFHMVKSDFRASGDHPPALKVSPVAAAILGEMLAREGSAEQPEKHLDALESAEPEKDTPQLETVWPADSDDEDEDHPLSGLPPLSPLNAPPDACSDLLLVQPPHFLRSAYEMLLGPLKTPITPLSEEVYGKPGDAPEPAATARARLLTALAELPKLIHCGSEELPRLAGPISSRLLRLEAVHDVADLKLKVLVSLLVADSSRRNAVQNLIAEFGSEDMPLPSRRMILDALSTASRELSSCQEDVERSGASKAALGTVGKTRRFASATQIPPSSTNRFASEARLFILPLVARWRQPAGSAAAWALGEASTVADFLHSLGVMLESAGRACPDKDPLARECSEPAMEGLSHTELLVRRCSLFVLSRIVLIGCEEVLLELPILMQLEAFPFVESDDTCRRMAAGLVASLSKRTLS
eukprot:s412_g23.t1